MELSIQQVARVAGITSRTLRHYAAIGLLPPSRVAGNGYRFYDDAALVRLQRILLLRELGLGLADIRTVLDRDEAEHIALERHLAWLRAEQERLARQIASVRSTLEARRREEEMVAEKMFDGFDHTQYTDEVAERWGAEAGRRSDEWWSGMTPQERASWQDDAQSLGAAWIDAIERGLDPAGREAQVLAARHVVWLTGIPGTPAAEPGGDLAGYVRGLGDMYVADERFARTYGGADGARFVRDALHRFIDARARG